MLYLSCFDFHLEHKARSLMAKADTLLRHADLKKEIESDNKDIMLLKPEFFRVHALRQGHLLIEGEEEKLLSRIRSSKDHKDAVVKAVEELKRSGTKTIRSDEWALEQGLVLYRGKVYVPKDTKLQTEIIKLHHDSLVAGHSKIRTSKGVCQTNEGDS